MKMKLSICENKGCPYRIPKEEKMRWFLTVDWCSKGNRGIFCRKKDGHSFSKEIQQTEEDMFKILGMFSIILSPQSIELTEEQLKEYHVFYPLAEYSNEYGIACKETVNVK